MSGRFKTMAASGKKGMPLMLNVPVRCRALLAIVILASACADRITPTGPTTPSETIASGPTSPTPPSPSDFPAVSRPARIYFARALTRPVHEWTIDSRYVLYDDGTFALQQSQSRGSFEHRGTYTEADAVVTLRWQVNQTVPAPWRPTTGTLMDAFLTVRYDSIMVLDGFEDAVYTRTP